MKKYIDLHTHTNASDGSMTPSELVEYAATNGLGAIAITDHDSIDGVSEALEQSKISGIEVIPGLEISVDYEPEMHILGYFSDENYTNIKGALYSLKESRNERNPKIIQKLREIGFEISMDEVREEATGEIIGRPHIARVLFKKGYIGSVKEAFDKYLSSGKPAFFKKNMLTPGEGIKIIKEAGGIPVLAHPVLLQRDYPKLERIVAELVKKGLGGIEAIYAENSEEDTKNHIRLANKYNLLITGGSDYHGNIRPNVNLGSGYGSLRVSYEYLVKLKEVFAQAGS